MTNEFKKMERKELLENLPQDAKDLIEIGIYTEDEMLERLGRICFNCLHESACNAWIRHGTILYDNFEYSVENCPYYMYSESVREVTIGEWEIYTDEYDCEYMKCSVCGGEFYPVDEDTVDTTPNYCQNCGAEMIKD